MNRGTEVTKKKEAALQYLSTGNKPLRLLTHTLVYCHHSSAIYIDSKNIT